MPEAKVTVVKLVIEGNRFEILVKPDLLLIIDWARETI